jgi:hypothetical protein
VLRHAADCLYTYHVVQLEGTFLVAVSAVAGTSLDMF